MMSKKPGLHRGSSRSGRSKRVAEQLFLRTYDLELEQAKDYRIWAYRKAAWTVDEWPENVAEIYEARGETALRELPNVGKSIAGQIARWLRLERNRASTP
jgi:DNA polymerase/3'-5' exonuclease PolX